MRRIGRFLLGAAPVILLAACLGPATASAHAWSDAAQDGIWVRITFRIQLAVENADHGLIPMDDGLRRDLTACWTGWPATPYARRDDLPQRGMIVLRFVSRVALQAIEYALRQWHCSASAQ